MYNHDEKDELELEAVRMIDLAENLLEAEEGRGDEAIDLFEKAAQNYLNLGSYIQLDELYIRIANVISKFKNNIQAVYRLKSIIRKTEELKIYEVSAKLLIQLGNVSNRMLDWETAGESYQKASEYFYESDPEEFHNLSSLLLLKAGQAFEKAHAKSDYGKRLILKAVMKMNKFDELYQTEEKRALHFLESNQLDAAANKFFDIASNFRKALDNLGEILKADEEESRDTFLTAKSRLIHFVAEYQTLSALCLKTTETPDNEKIKKLSLDSLELFKQSIELQKDYLLSIKVDYHREDLFRITFDAMLMSITQELIGTKEVNPIEFLLENIEKKLSKKLRETPYFKIVEVIDKIGFAESLDKLQSVHLGHFEEIKNQLILHLKKK